MIFLFDDKNEPADIFSDIPSEKPVQRMPEQLGSPAAPSTTGTTSPLPVGESGVIMESAPFGKKWVLIGVLAVLVLGGGGWFFFLRKPAAPKTEEKPAEVTVPTPEPEPTPEPVPAEITEPTPEPPVSETTDAEPATATEPVPSPEPPAPPAPPPVVDTDGDGLFDDEEGRLGTDINLADTDADGLTDREEVRTWATDPKNPDTDGDNFKDGQEVKGGYNPNGPGKIQQLPK